MALNFPSNPTIGQVHSDTDSGFSYEWDGVVWKSFITAFADGIATYASNAGIATYASNAGIATYASNAGITTYASTAGISTVAENLTNSPNIIVGLVTADSVSIGSSIQMGNVGIITAKSFHGDGSQLDGVTVNTSFLVSGRVSNTTILLSSGSFTIEGRSGNIDINA